MDAWRRKIRTLLFSTLYPSGVRPNHGIFVETRLRHLLRSGDVETKVVAPVPWFFSSHPRYAEYADFARTPRQEMRNGIDVRHPRYILPPRIGMNIAPVMLAAGALPTIRRIIAAGFDFDLIDAHYFYPDGVAAVILGRMLGKPVVITARGSDISQIPGHFLPRRMIQAAARRCAAMVTVCAALKAELAALGAEPARITVLRNGVDLERFQPVDRAPARARLGMSRFSLASVGYLIPRKGHDLIIAALPALPDVDLFIAGTGPDEASLKAMAQRLGVGERVRFLGALPQDELRGLYGAADCLVLASSREGWANVLLESMACGTPVVASDVWGTPEVVASAEAGVLMRERTSAGIVEAIGRLRRKMPDRALTRSYAEQFAWDATSAGQLDLFSRVIARDRADRDLFKCAV
jgi:teichuronic acid biosynthesis glycosyltransferase TuaC